MKALGSMPSAYISEYFTNDTLHILFLPMVLPNGIPMAAIQTKGNAFYYA